MTIKKQSKSDSRSYAEPRERGRPQPKDRSERNLRNHLHTYRGMDVGSAFLDDDLTEEYNHDRD
jgi:hypothetical protein